MAKGPHHLDGLIDLLVEAVLREMEADPRSEKTAPPAKADAALVDDERNRLGAQDTAITADRNRSPLPPNRKVRQLRHPLPPVTS